MARVFWKDRDPIGGRFMFGGPRPDQEPQWILVVGVVKDIKQRTLTERPQPFVMVPILQFYASTSVLNVRTASGLDAIGGSCNGRCARSIRACRSTTSACSPTIPRPRRSSEACRRSARRVRSPGAGAGGHRQLRRAVVSRRPAPARSASGSLLAPHAVTSSVSWPAAVRALDWRGRRRRVAVVDCRRYGSRKPLDRHRATDPITYAGVIGMLMLVAAAACLIPARRAATLDPAITLREE